MAIVIRTGSDYWTGDDWSTNPAEAKRYDDADRDRAEEDLDEIAAALEDGLDEPLEIVPFPRMGADDWTEPKRDSDEDAE